MILLHRRGFAICLSSLSWGLALESGLRHRPPGRRSVLLLLVLTLNLRRIQYEAGTPDIFK